MALVVIGTCARCDAQQLADGRILLAPERALDCQTHDFVPTDGQEYPEPTQQRPPARGGGMLMSMPSQKECIANDQLTDHLCTVEGKINQTQATIQTLDERHEHWRAVITDDFQRVVEAAETRRDKLLGDLDELVQLKQSLLSGQLSDYQQHYNDCQNMLDSIFERIQTHRRDPSRQEGIVRDSKDTVAAFPRLNAIPIAVAAECQTQPMVSSLNNFGAILESDLGRLPTVVIEEVNDSRQHIKYRVDDPEDAEEKTAVNFIQGLQVEVQASVFGTRSLGWNVAWTNRVPCENIQGTMRIDLKSLPSSEKVYIRARTIIINGKDPSDPVRISSWSDVSEMAITGRPPARLNVGPPSHAGQNASSSSNNNSNGNVSPPTKNIFVVCVDPSTGSKLPCRPAPPDYVSAIKNAAIRKFKWNSSPEDVSLKIVQKDGGAVVADLSEEGSANNLLADVWDRNSHFVHVFQSSGEPRPERSRSPPVRDVPVMEVSVEEENIEWPKRLMIRIKQQPTKDSPARPSPLRIEDRALPGGWLGALQKRYCERFSLEQEGEMRFFFVDDEGNRVKDIMKDSDFLYVQENRTRVYAVGERA